MVVCNSIFNNKHKDKKSTGRNLSIFGARDGTAYCFAICPLRLQVPSNQKNHPIGWFFILSMGYKKDIFGSFAYEFELTSECVIS